MDNILTLENISKRFGGVTTADQVSIDVPAGSICGLIGPNGAGKSTLFNLVTGNYQPDEGVITFNGVNVTRLKTYQRARLGLVRTFQNLRLFGNMSVYENIAVCSVQPDLLTHFSQIFGNRKILNNKKIYDIATLFGLGKYVNSSANSLPYGLQRRLELARCFATNPRFIILDEPIAGMNESEINDMVHIIRHINTEYGITVLLSEHDVSFVMKLCDTVFVLDKGRLISNGTPEQVSVDPVVKAAYFG